jgi:quinoprotein glucose dehydrogenase
MNRRSPRAPWRPDSGRLCRLRAQLAPDRKQFVVLAAGGHATLGSKMGDHVVAFTLP